MCTILLPQSPLNGREFDPDFQEEARAAREAGFAIARLDLDSLIAGDSRSVLRQLRSQQIPQGEYIYRGWMMTSDQYRELVQLTTALDLVPRTTLDQYKQFHEFPGGWQLLGDRMPRSTIFPRETLSDRDHLVASLSESLSGPALVKDYVKSRKHEWLDACFIPDVADIQAARRVIETFIERQGPELQGGLVIREMLDLVSLGEHPTSGMPIPVEYRTFFLGGRPLLTAPYWDSITYPHDLPGPPPQFLAEIGDRAGEGFFTADTVVTRNGTWYVVECGDGQVSQVPETADMSDFYRLLRERLTTAP